MYNIAGMKNISIAIFMFIIRHYYIVDVHCRLFS